MKIAILGGTGGTGRELVTQALERGHSLTLLVRNVDKAKSISSKTQVLAGNPTNTEDLERAFTGQDAVVTTLGAPGPGACTILGDAAGPTIRAMQKAHVSRLLLVSAAVLFPDAGIVAAILRATLLRNIAKDSAEMERIARESDRDWTIARPPRLTNGPHTRKFRVMRDHLPGAGTATISRADVAHFLLDELERPQHVRQIVGMASA